MGGRSGTIFRIIAVLAVIFLLFTLIQVLDRLHQNSVQMTKALESIAVVLETRQMMMPAAVPSAANPVPEKSPVPPANAEYFDRAAKNGGKLVTALSADVPGFNPITVNEASSSQILGLCSSPLASRDWQHPEIFKPMLAESWEVSPDRLTYRIKLRRNTYWQEYTCPDTGKPVPSREITADDFVFYAEVIKNPDVNCASLRNYFNDLESVTAVNSHELLVKWRKPYYGSLAITLGMTPLPRDYYCRNGKFGGKAFNNDFKRNSTIISSGPYRLTAWDKENRIVLQRNRTYFGIALGIAPPLLRREFEIIKHPDTQMQALLGGKLDMLGLSSEQWVQRGKDAPFVNGTLKRFKYRGRGYSYIGYNHDVHCFKDADTRRALTLLIDREKIMKEIHHDLGAIANGPFAPGTPFADPELQPYRKDTAAAKALLKKAGWRDTDGDGILERDGKPFRFTMMQIANQATQMRTLPIIKEAFAEAGIDMQLQSVEWSVYVQKLNKREFEACNLGWTGSIDPDPYQIFHSSQIDGGSNFVGYKNPEVDRLIEELRGEFDIQKRIALCRRIEKHLYDDQPYTFMFYPDSLVAVSGKFRNVRLFPEGLETLTFWMP